MFSKNEINQVVEKVKEASNPDKIYLFGSYAYGNPNENSDLDLCIIKKEVKDKSKEYIKIRRVLSHMILPMDILILNEDEFEKRKDIFGAVQYEINKKGIILYESRN